MLGAGETILLYTNGIVEAQLPETRDEFGIEGLSRVVRDMYSYSPHELIDAVNEAVTRYCAPARPHDDCSMIALKRVG